MSWASQSFPSSLDHLIIGCSDLQGGIRFVGDQLGVRAAMGGVHPGRGTANALLSLGDRHYLEIMGLDPDARGLSPEYAAEVAELKKLDRPRLVGWAAHRNDLDNFARKLSAAGLDVEGPVAGSRVRPDGKTLRWKTLGVKNDPDNVLPFFIEWDPSSVHPSVDAPAGCHLESFSIGHPNPAALSRQFEQLELGELPVEQNATPQLRLVLASAKGSLRITS